MSKRYDSVWIAVSATLLLSFLYCPPFDVFNDDKEIFRYTGQAILKGMTPYSDFFDHKPPLIFFLNDAGLLLGPWGLWIIDTLLVLAATLLLFRLARKFQLSYPWLLPLFFNLVLRDHMFCNGIGMTREYTAILLLIAFCVALGEYRRCYLILGLISGLTFFMQQDQVLPLLPFLALALLSKGPVPIGIRFLQAVTGFLIIALPLILYFAANHALADAWKDAFVFNFNWYTTEKFSPMHRFKAIKNGLNAVNAGMAFLVALTLGIAALFLKNTRKQWVLACFLSVLLSLSAVYLSGRPMGPSFYYYYLPLSASLSTLLFTVFAFTEDQPVRARISQLLYGILLCIMPGYAALQFAAGLGRNNGNFVKDSPEMVYLRQHPPKDYQLYVFGNSNYDYAYNEFRILSPSRWIYHHFWFWYDQWDADLRQITSITEDLRKHHTTYILDLSNPALFKNAAHYASWSSFLQKNYTPLMTDSSGHALWMIK